MRTVAAIALFLVLGGCASAPETLTVQGNGSCHPSQSLPAHKTVPKAPEADIPFQAFWNWVVDLRKQEGVDVNDYNTLYDECVTKPSASSPDKVS